MTTSSLAQEMKRLVMLILLATNYNLLKMTSSVVFNLEASYNNVLSVAKSKKHNAITMTKMVKSNMLCTRTPVI